jgi:hypothetical protein
VGKSKFSQKEKVLLGILPIAASVALALACALLGGPHRIASIWLFFASTVIYDGALWLFLKGLFPRRNLVALVVVVLAFVAFGAWDVHSRDKSKEQPSKHYETYGDQSPIMPNNKGTVIINDRPKDSSAKKENSK